MVALLQQDFLDVINERKNGAAPNWTSTPSVLYEDTSATNFDVCDSKGIEKIIVLPGTGVASYENSQAYFLRLIAYDKYLQQFVFDDGEFAKRSMFRTVKAADYLVFDDETKNYFIVNEISEGKISNKRKKGREQLSTTVEWLCKCAAIKSYIQDFKNRICYLSVKEIIPATTPLGMGDPFLIQEKALDEPLKFPFGQIDKNGFIAYESTKIVLS